MLAFYFGFKENVKHKQLNLKYFKNFRESEKLFLLSTEIVVFQNPNRNKLTLKLHYL